jgi:hypothetical protein
VSDPKGSSNSEMTFYEEWFPLSVIMNNFQTKGKNGTLVEHLPSNLEDLSSNHRVFSLLRICQKRKVKLWDFGLREFCL